MKAHARKGFLAFLLVGIQWSAAFAQNLIPNAGFEEVFTASDHQWVQPQGPFYHYERTDSATAHHAHTGEFVNGICMYNNEPNEYLHIKLLEPLERGMLYKLSVMAILMRAKCYMASEQRYIGVFFGKERLDTHIPGDYFFEPQINLELPEGNRFEWFQMTDSFRAEGGEQYLTMGYFPGTQKLESMAKAQDAFFDEIELRNKAKEANQKNESMSWLYLSPEEQKKYLKEQKKKEKKKEKNPEPEADPIERVKLGRGLEFDPLQSALDAFFAVRYYFDDFCLARVDEKGRTNCKTDALTEEIAPGRTIRLQNVFFDTDKAVLLSESMIQLEALEKLLNDFPKMKIEIRGYTDSQGDETYNLELSRRRAAAVVTWLTSQGISADRLTSAGFGESEPLATNETEAGRTLNRRVTFLILSM